MTDHPSKPGLRWETRAERRARTRTLHNAAYANAEAFIDPMVVPIDLTPPPEPRADEWAVPVPSPVIGFDDYASPITDAAAYEPRTELEDEW